MDGDEVATEALVFMAVGITGNWKCPFAYFLIKEISATVQAQLVLHWIELLGDAGIQVRAITLDGHKTNVSMLKKLGCDLCIDSLSSSFMGHCGTDVHVFMDPSHCLKMVRNNFAKLRRIEVPGVGTAQWSHIVRLHELQCREKMHAANKLSNRHIEFEQQKMKVRITFIS